MVDEERIQKIHGRLDWLKHAEERGRNLMSFVPRATVYVGMCGAQFSFDEFQLSSGIGSIRKVTNPPGIVSVFRAADTSKTDYLGVTRYSAAVQGELAFGPGRVGETKFFLDVAWHTAALIKLRQHPNIICPCFATESWDIVSAVTENRIEFGLLDDVPRPIRAPESGPITSDDMAWVDRVWDIALDLRSVDKSLRFGLAFNIAYTWNQTNDVRIALAHIWCGIEALFGDKQDRPVTRKIVEKICTWLPSLKNDDVEDCYNLRCDAVHGRRLGKKINSTLAQSHEVLRAALVRCIDKNSVPLPDWT